MAKRFTITFSSDQTNEFYDRVFWFGESMYSAIAHNGLGTICDVDKAREVIWFELHNAHDLGKAKAILRKELARAKLTADAIVTIY